MESDEKKCPACAETVKAEAKVCKHCGYKFESGQAAGTTVHPVLPKKGGCGKVGMIIAAVIVGLIIIAAIVGGGETGPQQGSGQQGADAEPPLKVTARELFAAYDANEAAAQQTYGKRKLEVTGTVAGVDLDFADKPVVLLRTQNEFMNAQASLIDEANEAKASSLQKGQQVVMVCGSVGEVIGTPMLKDCTLP